jgi:hypothetical protein
MSHFSIWDLPDDCPHCGRPLMASNGQSIISTVAMSLDENGVTVYPDTQANWCGACVEEWNARMTR